MKISEILQEAKADIEDEAAWFKGGWAADQDYITSENDLLHAGQVCAVTSVVRVCVKRGLVDLAFTETVERDHYCDCPHCDTSYEEDEVEHNLEAVMGDFTHPAWDVLNQAATELYGTEATAVNDDSKYTHEDVMKIYDRAIELAQADEAVLSS